MITGGDPAADGDADFAEAVEELAVAVRAADPADPEAVALHLQLASAYEELFADTGDVAALAQLVVVARHAALLVGDDHPDRADLLATASAFLFEAEEFLDRPELLDEAIAIGRRAVAGGGTAMANGNLGTALRIRYESAGKRVDLDEAEQHVATAVAISVGGAGWLAEYGHVLRLRADRTGDVADARRAVAAIRDSLSGTPPEDPTRPARQAALAGALLDCYQMGEDDVLGTAVDAARAALAADPGSFVVCQICATVFHIWADRFHDLTMLGEAEEAAQATISAAGENVVDRAEAWAALANVLAAKFEMTGDPAHLTASIDAGGVAVTAEVPNTVDRAGHIGNLGAALQARYQLLGDRADLDAAADADRAAVAMLDDDHPDLARYWNNLGVVLRDRYSLTGNEDDLAESIAAARTAVEFSGGGPAAAFRLANLGTALHVRHDRFGELQDLDESIDRQRDAVWLIPPDDPDLPGQLMNLANGLRVRHRRLGGARDLTEALDVLRDALAASPRPLILPDVLSAYGVVLHAAAENTGDHAQHDEAIEHLRRAIELSTEEDPGFPGRLANLVSVLETVADAPPTAMAEAVASARRALAGLHAGHPDRPAIRSTLALALRARDTGDDASEAVQAAVTAVDESDPGQAGHAELLMNLAVVLRSRAATAGDPADLERALAALRSAARTHGAPPAVRLRAAQAWARLAEERGDVAAAADGFDLAVRLLPEVSPHRLERRDAQRWLAAFNGLAGAAAAMCLARDDPERAVVLLESGRGVLLNRGLRVSADTDDLRAVDRELAEQFESLRDRLDSLGLTDQDPPMVGEDGRRAWTSRNPAREQRRDLVTAFDEVVARIRERPGFANFLQPPDLAPLLEHAADGPVVLVNVSEYRCDALVLTVAGVRHVPLPALDARRLDNLALDFHASVARAAESPEPAVVDAAEERLTDILDWLWTTVTAPVLAVVTDAARAGTKLRWVPTGALSFLPLHAATSRETGDSVLDRVVSSYSPTVTALSHPSRAPGSAEPSAAVIVSGEPGGGWPTLPSSVAEARYVATLLRADLVDATTAPREAVESAFRRSTRLHLSSHARSDPADPSASCLLFPGYELSVADLARIRNIGAEFAFLSACETTLTTAELADEAIHLTSACRLAGFPRVVGTLWMVRDAIAARAARTFYEELHTNGGDTDVALHNAVLRLRHRYSGRPSAWAAYHHVGG